jgi:DNA-binding transcriptional LysR family regulator
MPRVLALFAQNYPQIDLKVQVNSTRINCKKNVINREIDIAVVGGEIPDELKKNLTLNILLKMNLV